MDFVDLHAHSTASDGTLSPTELVRTAKDAGLTGIALTDHDTVAGCAEAADVARALGVEFIPGIEISAEYPRPGTMHLLGYGIDPADPALATLTQTLLAGREGRNERIVARLQTLGVAITLQEVLARAAGTVGRPHIAGVLVAKGYASSTQQAFSKYLGQGGSVYEDKETMTPARAIEMIRRAGGVAVLAHPVQLKKENFAQLANEVKALADSGLGGIECIHSDHREAMVAELSELADRFGLVKTGGSDYHGGSKPHIRLGYAGGRRVPREWFDTLRATIQNARADKA